MSLQTKSILFQFLCFAVLFIGFHYLISAFTNLQGFWIPVTAFVVSTILAPKFQVVRTKDGEKLFVKWLFFSGVRQIK